MGRYKHYIKITVKVLHEITGRHEETIRRHIRDGKFDPWDLDSIIKWVKENRRIGGNDDKKNGKDIQEDSK